MILSHRPALAILVFAAAVLLASSLAMAQDAIVPSGDPAAEESAISGVAEEVAKGDATLDPNLFVGIQDAYKHSMALRTPDVRPGEMKTLFFTLWQHKLLQEAKRQFTTRGATEDEIFADTPPAERPRGIRELSLGGILYTRGDSWIVWLNGQRVTPEAIPKQVIDINVHKDYIEMKWFDAYTNLIFPVRLRPHQRFNLDTRIFLPGTPS